MLIPHVVQTEADKVFVNILNNQAVALSDGDAVVWDTTAPDGVKTTQAATATIGLFVGVADGAIAAGAYGLAQAYGYKASALVSADSATASAVAGASLIPVAAQDWLTTCTTGVAPATEIPLNVGFCYSAEARTDTDTAALQKVFIRAL